MTIWSGKNRSIRNGNEVVNLQFLPTLVSGAGDSSLSVRERAAACGAQLQPVSDAVQQRGGITVGGFWNGLLGFFQRNACGGLCVFRNSVLS